ncbi:MAG: ABC transporter substrate-binding protein [Myxococcales bacterium]|nr:ABC transporter substrate-binding protein [Myxococcales bacterium]MCB9626339.1 ABC transporter substrate-binding protein [Sandaracinaceae bacterium]
MTPSTPRSRRHAEGALRRALPGVLLTLAAVCCGAYALTHIPERPQGPRYVGAGNATPRTGGTFVFGAGSDLHSLDPHIAYDANSYMAIRLVFDGLLDYDEQGQMVPSLASAMPEVSEDGRTFTFHLREGVLFHESPVFDGPRELVAEDVRWSLERLLHPDTGSPGVSFFARLRGFDDFRAGRTPHIAGIDVRGRYEVAFTLDQADQTFLSAMAMVFAYPVPHENYEHHIAQGDPGAVERNPVGTGPFVFEAWERGVQLTFTRNKRYWERNRPNPDRMVLIEQLSGETAVGRFSNGDLDVLTSLPAVHYLFFKHAPAWAPYMAEEPEATIRGLCMNTGMAPFDNVHVRRAVAAAIDREAMRVMAQGRALPAGQILPPMIPGYDPGLPSLQRYDLARAQEEMRLAGYPNGIEEPVTAWIGEGQGSLVAAQLWGANLERIGIHVEYRQVAFSVYLEETGKPGQAQLFPSAWNMDFPDPSNFLEILFHSQNIHPTASENRSFYRNPELDALLDQARGEPDRERRLALYRQANDIVSRDAPWAFLSNDLGAELWQPYVMNYRPHPVWSNDYRNVWLDLPRVRVADSTYTEGATP